MGDLAMQEFVLVTFVENRRVFVGGQHMGFTNRVFTVTTGVHTVFLDDPRDYGPSSITACPVYSAGRPVNF
jgi:hypothetical protein